MLHSPNGFLSDYLCLDDVLNFLTRGRIFGNYLCSSSGDPSSRFSRCTRPSIDFMLQFILLYSLYYPVYHMNWNMVISNHFSAFVSAIIIFDMGEHHLKQWRVFPLCRPLCHPEWFPSGMRQHISRGLPRSLWLFGRLRNRLWCFQPDAPRGKITINFQMHHNMGNSTA